LYYTAAGIITLKQVNSLKLIINFTTICTYLQNYILVILHHSLVSV